jgi:hypothetical protein
MRPLFMGEAHARSFEISFLLGTATGRHDQCAKEHLPYTYTVHEGLDGCYRDLLFV